VTEFLIIGIPSLFCAMLFSLHAGDAKSMDVTNEAGRKRWAYPAGVIVTQDGGKVSEPAADSTDPKTPGTASDSSKKREEERQFHTVPKESATEKALREAALAAEKELLSCAESLRARIPETVLVKPTISLRLIMPIAADGTVAFVDYEGRPVPPYFIECTSKNMVFFKSLVFPPRLDQRMITAKLRLEARFLTDEEAQGRGYQFYAAEEKWEKTEREHPEWFRCHSKSECVTSNERCEIRSVNEHHLQAYIQAMRERQKRFCPTPPDPATFPSTCQKGKCAVPKLRQKR
jgi:hypothetical protein